MHFRSILSGTLAIMLIAATAQASDGNPVTPRAGAHGAQIPRLMTGLFGKSAEPTYQTAQAVSDPRVVALEEQVRALNGTVEELNFQVLQLQEQIRKMQEDNEFRFQELEKKSDARGPKSNQSVAGAGQKQGDRVAAGTSPEKAAPGSVEDVIGNDQTNTTGTGEPPSNMGAITFDANGNPVGGKINDSTAADGTTVAALPTTNDPEELYRNAYQFILSGDYGTAEAGFRDHIARFPGDARTPDAHFWLGESLLGQKKYRDAAEVFLAANKDYPKSKKAPDMLLKLGISLVGLNQRDVACATFSEVTKRYPDVSTALKDRVKQEKALASC